MVSVQTNIGISVNAMKHHFYCPTPQLLCIFNIPSFCVPYHNIGHPFQTHIVILHEGVFYYLMLQQV